MGKRISLADVKKSAFVGKPVLKTVEYLLDGELCEFNVYIRKLSYQSAVNDGQSFGANRDKFVAGRIAACVLDEDGHPVFESIDQIMGLGAFEDAGPISDDLTCALFAKIEEVNPSKKSSSTTNQNSGANSSLTESGDAQSTTPSDESVSESSESGKLIETEEAH